MKKYIFTLSACLFLFASAALATGKGYKLKTHAVTLTKVDTAGGDELQIPVLDTTSANLTIKWTIVNNSFTFTGWNYWFCDLNQCYTGAYPAKNTDVIMPAANGGTASFSITVNSYKHMPGNAIMQIAMYDVNDPADIDTITLQIYATRLGVANAVMPSGTVNVFPNPAINNLTISSTVPGFVPVKATVTDVTGKTVAAYSISPADNNRISVASLPSGLYFIRFQDQAERIATENFIKE